MYTASVHLYLAQYFKRAIITARTHNHPHPAATLHICIFYIIHDPKNDKKMFCKALAARIKLPYLYARPCICGVRFCYCFDNIWFIVLKSSLNILSYSATGWCFGFLYQYYTQWMYMYRGRNSIYKFNIYYMLTKHFVL